MPPVFLALGGQQARRDSVALLCLLTGELDMADFRELLNALAEKDQIFRIQCKITNLHAVQGRNDTELERTHKAIDQTHITTHEEGLASGEKTSPQVRKRGRRKMTSQMIQAYQFEPAGRKYDEKKQSTIMLEIGGAYGLMSKAMRDAVVAKDKAKYWLPGLTLIAFKPVKALPGTEDYVEAKIKTALSVRIEPRNGKGGNRVMVPVYHEFIAEPLLLDVEMVVNSECPRTIEEVGALLHAMQHVPFGPAKRGHLKVVDVKKVQ
jgi:hypothetical protein